MATDKEALYDKHISPLMSKIIALCKKHRINMAAQFSLGEDPDADNDNLWCTTVLQDVDPDDKKGVEMMRDLRRVMQPKPLMFAITVTSGAKP